MIPVALNNNGGVVEFRIGVVKFHGEHCHKVSNKLFTELRVSGITVIKFRNLSIRYQKILHNTEWKCQTEGGINQPCLCIV